MAKRDQKKGRTSGGKKPPAKARAAAARPARKKTGSATVAQAIRAAVSDLSRRAAPKPRRAASPRPTAAAPAAAHDDSARLQELEEALALARADTRAARDEAARLRSGGPEADQVAGELRGARQEHSELRARAEDRETELTTLRDAREALGAELVTLRREGASGERVRDELRAARDEISRLQAMVTPPAPEPETAVVAAARAEIARLGHENDRLRRLLDAAEGDAAR